MTPQRRLKSLKTKIWFKPMRGGANISRSKDHPSIHPLKWKGPRPKTGWKVKGPGESQNKTSTKEEGTGPRAKVKVIETPIKPMESQGSWRIPEQYLYQRRRDRIKGQGQDNWNTNFYTIHQGFSVEKGTPEPWWYPGRSHGMPRCEIYREVWRADPHPAP